METDRLQKINACLDAVEWVRSQPDTATAWAKCTRADWLIWIVFMAIDRKRAVAILCQCIRATCWDVMPPAGRKCIKVTEAWTRGKATIKKVNAASDGAWAAAMAANAAASAATWAASDAVRAALAASAATWAANAAANAATWAASAATSAARPARDAAHLAMCNIIRAEVALTEIETALETKGEQR